MSEKSLTSCLRAMRPPERVADPDRRGEQEGTTQSEQRPRRPMA
jgi:hypothetical protein